MYKIKGTVLHEGHAGGIIDVAEYAAGVERPALIEVRFCGVQRTDADQLRGMDEATAADVDAYMVDPLGLFFGRGRPEEKQVARFEGVKRDLHTGLDLL